jgi:hypothetical protein
MAGDSYRVRTGSRVLGPFKADRLIDLLVEGKIDAEVMVCRSGETEWVAWSDVPELGGGSVVESGGVVVGDDVDDAADYMKSLSIDVKDGGGSNSEEDDEVYALRGIDEVPEAIGSGIPLPKTVPESASSGDDSVSPPTVTKTAAGSSRPPVADDSEWDIDEDIESVADVLLDEEYDVDVDAADFVVEVSSGGLNESERRLIKVVAVCGFVLIGAFVVVAVTYWVARGG